MSRAQVWTGRSYNALNNEYNALNNEMTVPNGFDLFTVGHSNLTAERFLSLIKNAGVTSVMDVRSVPFSRRFPWFSARTLAERLQTRGIAYVALGGPLGGRPDNMALYCDGIADYEAMAEADEFRRGLERVIDETRNRCACLMCAEREPLDCHRCLLVTRALAKRGCSVGHILGDGAVEAHAVTEERLLTRAGLTADLFGDRDSRLLEAYRWRSQAIAARLSDRARPGRTPRAFMPS